MGMETWKKLAKSDKATDRPRNQISSTCYVCDATVIPLDGWVYRYARVKCHRCHTFKNTSHRIDAN